MSAQEISPTGPSLPLSTNHFYLFNQLPFELRRSIWKLCRPHRIIELDLVLDILYWPTGCTGVVDTSYLNSRLPIITQVCRESRAVAFECNAGDKHITKGLALGFKEFGCFDPSTDVVHLNWNANQDPEHPYWDTDISNPLDDLQTAAQGIKASLTADLIYPFHITSFPSYPNFYFEGYNETYKRLEFRNDYLVTLEMVILHVSMDDALASGLFGRLAEEPIVLVSTADEELIQKYHGLWLAGPLEDRGPEKFFKESKSLYINVQRWKYTFEVYWLRFKCAQAISSGAALREDLDSIWYDTIGLIEYEPGDYAEGPGSNWSGLFDENHPFAKKVLEDMPRFSPVIMFRLCNRKCYESKEETDN